MICVGYPCDSCKHKHKQLKDGWIITCDAFPEGVPSEHYYNKEIEDLNVCSNEIGYANIG